MITRAFLLLVIGGWLAGDPAPGDANKKDLAMMQGDWNAMAMVRDGMKIPDDDAHALFRTIKGQEYIVYRYDMLAGKGTFTIDATKNPKTIDAHAGSGPAKGKPMLGIYEIDGNTYKVSFALPGKERPTDFSAKEDSGHTVTIWEREKK